MDNYPTYTFNGIILSEINLFITDMVLTAVAIYCYASSKKDEATKGFVLFFLFTGLSAFGAGFGHLFTYYAGQYIKVVAWIFSLLANLYMLQASARVLTKRNAQKLLNTFATVKCIAGLVLLLWFLQFIVITLDTVISIGLISLPILFVKWQQTQHNGYKLICYGIVFTMLTAVVGGLKLSLSDEWFNHKDINHIIICGGLLLMCNGVKKLNGHPVNI